jgi:hypothetical protein
VAILHRAALDRRVVDTGLSVAIISLSPRCRTVAWLTNGVKSANAHCWQGAVDLDLSAAKLGLVKIWRRLMHRDGYLSTALTSRARLFATLPPAALQLILHRLSCLIFSVSFTCIGEGGELNTAQRIRRAASANVSLYEQLQTILPTFLWDLSAPSRRSETGATISAAPEI